MKIKTLAAIAILGAVFQVSCIRINASSADDQTIKMFELSDVIYPEIISMGETVVIDLSINRPSNYTGIYLLKYQQALGNGRGLLSYDGEEIGADKHIHLSKDEVKIRYTAMSKNYHRADFEILDEHGQMIDFKVAMNAELEGESDYSFSASLSEIPSEISINETVNLSLSLTPGALYEGDYFVRMVQKKGNGVGVLRYQGNIISTMQYPVKGNSVTLTYTATTKNYHEFEIIVSDDMQREKSFIIIINEDKKGADDYAFSATIEDWQPNIEANETNALYINFNPGVLYSDSYYIEYKQSGGHGLGVLRYDNTTLTEGVPYKLRGLSSGEIPLTYKATTKNYHELDIKIYDMEGREIDFKVIFNEDKKGNDDYAFSASVMEYSTSILADETRVIDINFEPGILYTGEYYMIYRRPLHQGYGTISCGAKPLSHVKPLVLTNYESGKISLSYKASSRNYHEIEVEIYDADGRKFVHTIKLNEDKKGLPDPPIEVSYTKPDNPTSRSVKVTFNVRRVDLDYKKLLFVQISPIRGIEGKIFGLVGINGLTSTTLSMYEYYPLEHDSNGNFYITISSSTDLDHVALFVYVKDDRGNRSDVKFTIN